MIEYDKDFKIIWSYDIKSPWAAIRLHNSNTLITDEKDELTREVDPAGKTVWEFKLADLPPELKFKGCQSCVRLANGNTVFCSRGDGKNSQLVEITSDKKVVWAMRLEELWPGHRRANAGRSRHPRKAGRLAAIAAETGQESFAARVASAPRRGCGPKSTTPLPGWTCAIFAWAGHCQRRGARGVSKCQRRQRSCGWRNRRVRTWNISQGTVANKSYPSEDRAKASHLLPKGEASAMSTNSEKG